MSIPAGHLLANRAWRLAAEAAILDLFRRAQWSTQDASTPAGDQRIQTLTAPHGPDARGVTLAA